MKIHNWLYRQNIKPMFISDSMCMRLWMCMIVECCLLSEALVSVCKECGASEFVLGTHSHFISFGTGLPDHHTSVTAHSVLSAVAQTCQVHLYSSIPLTISPWASQTCREEGLTPVLYYHMASMVYLSVICQRFWDAGWCTGMLLALTSNSC